MFWWLCIAAVIGYGLGYHDGRWAKPPPPLKGNYEGCESIEEQERDYEA